MKTFSLILSMLMLASCTLSAKNNVPAEYYEKTSWHEVKVADWTQLAVTGAYTVEVKVLPDSVGTVRVLANDAMMRDLKAVADGGILRVSPNPGEDMRLAAPLIVAYTNGDFSMATLKGSGDILLPALKTNSRLKLLLKGSGDIELIGASVAELEAILQGSGDIDINKTTVKGTANLTLQGSGDIDVHKLKAKTVNAKLQGSGDIDLNGNTTMLNLVVQGSGDIDAANMKADEINANAMGSGGITIGHAAKVVTKGKSIRQSKKIKH